MNIKVKTTLIIIITLALGIFIGAMLNRALLQHRIRSVFSMRNPNRLVPIYEEIIKPDTTQSELIREILIKHAQQTSEIRASFRQQMQSALESMRAEIEPLLTPTQKKRLKRRFLGRLLFPNQRPKKTEVKEELQVLKEKLRLTLDQAARVRRVLEESRNRAIMIRKERRNSRRKWQVLKELEEKKEKAIEKILTKDQKKLYEQIKRERHKKIGASPLPMSGVKD